MKIDGSICNLNLRISKTNFSRITSIDLFLFLKAEPEAFKPFQIGKPLTLNAAVLCSDRLFIRIFVKLQKF